MSQEQYIAFNPDELDEDLNINLEKVWNIVWSRKWLIIRVFCLVLAFFVALTFILPKKYKVTADLYINKANSSNMGEVNPYVLSETSSAMVSMGTDKAINNEIELMKSALVLDKVIRDNDLKYKKLYGFIPNKKEGEYLTAKAFYKKGKKLKLENVKNTNVISITYTANKPELAYGVVSSLITNYIELHKELNSEKSKADKQLIESEYKIAKENLNKKLNQVNGLPAQSMAGLGNLSAMSAFSRSASSAMGSIKSQYMAGEKSEIAVSEEKQKVIQLASKLEWAKMVEQMSDSSKVLVIDEPKMLRPFENSSPKLIIYILLGCLFGGLSALIALIHAEMTDKKLCYSMLTDNIIFKNNKTDVLKTKILSYNPKNILLVPTVQMPNDIINNLQTLSNLQIAYPDVSKEFVEKISASNKVILASKIGVTNSDTYKTLRDIIQTQEKEVLYDVLL